MEPISASSPTIKKQEDDDKSDKRDIKPIPKTLNRVPRACNACRKQKMRCEGADSPPCKRCRNNGFECLFEKPSREATLTGEAGLERVRNLESHVAEIRLVQSRQTTLLSELVDLLRANGSINTIPKSFIEPSPSLNSPSVSTPTVSNQHASPASAASFPMGHTPVPNAAVPRQHRPSMPHAYPNAVTGSSAQQPLQLEEMQATSGYPNYPSGSQNYNIHDPSNVNPVPSSMPNMPPPLSQQTNISSMRYQQADPGHLKSSKQGSKRHASTSIVTSADSSDLDDDDGGELPSSGLVAPLEVLRTLADVATERAAKESVGDSSEPHSRARTPSPERRSRNKKRRKIERIPTPLAYPDVVTKGVISEAEARELFKIYYDGCSTFLPVFDSSVDTFDSLHKHSPFAVNAICLVAARVRDGGDQMSDIHRKCLDEVQAISSKTLFTPVARIDVVQSMILVSGWSDNGWLSGGHAVRMAMELSMHKAWPRLLKRMNNNTKEDPSDRELVVAARTWFCLYLFEHQLSYGTGRPAVLKNDESIRDCRFLVNHPYAIEDDMRLVSTVELIAIRERVHNLLTPLEGPVRPEHFVELHRADIDFGNWYSSWDSAFSRKYEDAAFYRQSLQIQHLHAALFHNATALRDISSPEDVRGMPDAQRKLALDSIGIGRQILDITVNSPSYRKGMMYAVHYTHATATFAASFLLRLARLFPEKCDMEEVRGQVENLATLMASIPGKRYALTLEIMLKRSRRRKNNSSSLSPTVPREHHLLLTMSSSQQLPFVPSLPPLQLPSYDLTSLSVTPSDKPTSHLLQSPSLSVAESFSTAYTSTTPADDSQDLSRIPSALLVPPNSLRKSVSVDSFAHFTRDDGRPPLTDESDLSPVPAHSSFAADETEPIPAWSSRSRGLSLSSIQQSYQPVDSDVDRYEPSSLPAAERFRRQSLKSPESPQSLLRGGDLTLPSRSSSSNVPNLTEHSDLPSVASASSFQPTHKRTNPYQLPTMGRLRSGSLGYNRPPAKVVNPPISPFNRQSPTKAEIVILVIGTKGCGKSTVIKKGLSRFGLAVDWDKAPADASGTNRTRYIRRTGSMLLDQPPESPGSVPQAFDVLEVEVQRTNDGLLKWPQGLPPIDGVVICYDYSDINSYRPVEGLLKHYRGMMLPIMVLGCKTDLKHDVDPHDVVGMLAQYDTGLIEVSNTNDEGKAKMRKSFDYLIKAILRQRGPNRIVDNRNPATPSILVSDNSLHAPTNSPTLTRPNRSSTNINAPELSVLTSNLYDASLHGTPASHISSASVLTSNLYDTTLQGTPTSHISGELVNSNDIPQGNAQESDFQHPDYTPDRDSTGNSPNLNRELEQYLDQPAPPKKEPRPSQYAELEELLDKLLFLAVSGDEPTYAIHFLLTYRKFTTPRYVLLAMQKRMRQLDSPCGDPMFACFAQMRICHLLETWINSYAHDFAVKGTAGALNALIKSIISKTHLLHYGSEFLPFLEQLPSLVDEDTAWAMKADVSDTDSDDYTPEEEEEIRIGEPVEPEICSPELPSHSPQIIFPLRERKASLPLSKVRLSVSHSNGHHPTSAETHPKQYIKDLVKLAQDVMNTDSEEIAQEITRQAVGRFMIIKPRDWLNFTFVSKKLPGEPITAYNAMSNHLADWVVSLILCHDRPRQRARQIEKFVDIGVKLRNLNNYSALRAFVAGINNANDDATMELFKSKSHDHAKNLRSWDVLLQQVRAHRAYRLALRNSKGACIPAMEVHISDLIRAQEGNGDRSPIFPSKIHWGKFNMMGRFVTTTVQCQNQCRNSNDYDFPERPHIASLLNRCDVMSTEMQKSRLKSQDDYYEEPSPTPPSQPVNVTGMRRIFFW